MPTTTKSKSAIKAKQPYKAKHALPSFVVMREEDIIPLLEESLKKAEYDKAKPLEEVVKDLHRFIHAL